MDKIAWNKLLKPYAKSSLARSVFQIVDTIVPYIALWILDGFLIRSQIAIGFKVLGVMLFGMLGGLLMVRIFILFHDCTHMNFFKSKLACALWGHVFGILTFTPYRTWQHEHNIHHGTVGNLDRRGIGDVWTLTVNEYLALPRFKRFLYRSYRNPFILFGFGPIVLFGLLNRFPTRKTNKAETLSYIVTDLGILAVFLLTWLTFGWQAYLLIQLPMLFVAATLGVWLFYVQHQFDEVYWAHHDSWDIVKAALEGSTFLKLPSVLNWFTGNIGYHHIHHLNPRIPNYNLKRCFKEVEGLVPRTTVGLFSSFRLALLDLYDEVNGKMIGFRQLKSN